jgi:hypothetical protein
MAQCQPSRIAAGNASGHPSDELMGVSRDMSLTSWGAGLPRRQIRRHHRTISR